MAEKALFIINATSGKRFRPIVEAQIIAACSKYNLDGEIEYTRQKGHATVLAREAVASGLLKVFACGGDGTVNEVAQALVHTSTLLGILPMGSGNGLARHLHIPVDTQRALKLLPHYTSISMDTMIVNDHRAVNVAGIGFDAHVAGLFGKNGKRGLSEYARLVMKEYRGFKEFEAKLSMDGKPTEHNAFVVALANSSQFGNNARIAPHASVCDGVMDVCFIRKIPLIEAVGFTAKLFMGKVHKSRFVTMVKASQFSIEVSLPMPYHIDGEPFPPTKSFEVRMEPGSLKVMVPAMTPTSP